jgi:predicted nucleotide-binding protein
MASRKPPPPPAEPTLTPDQIRLGIDRLKRRIAELEAFEPTTVNRRWSPETKTLQVAIDETLSRIFGHNTPAYYRYSGATELDMGGISSEQPTLNKVHGYLTQGKARALALLNQAVKSLEEDLSEMPDESIAAGAAQPQPIPASDEIFIVHGHDEAAKTEVAHFVERAGLKAVILHQQPNAGKTIIEKFEKHGSAAGFAIVIATPDDLGGISSNDLKPRARQNVIGEMFWFAGRLGRDRVCALIKPGVDMPSDFAGVGYTPKAEISGGRSAPPTWATASMFGAPGFPPISTCHRTTPYFSAAFLRGSGVGSGR